jgi:hypothetical protein
MVKKGTTCYGSQVGQYGFRYPDQNKEYVFASDAIITKMPWMQIEKFIAVKVAKGFVEGRPPRSKKDIVWIKPDDIQAY